MRTATQKKMTLFRDELQEARLTKQVEQQRANIQQAVDEFNKLGLKPLQADDLSYFIGGGLEYLVVKWQSQVTVPDGFEPGKYYEMLKRPDFTATLGALKECNLLTTGLFILEGNEVAANKSVAAKYVDQHSIYLDGPEVEVMEDLKTMVRLLERFGMIRHNENRMIQPVNLNVTGLRFIPYVDDKYQFSEVPQLKEFIQKYGQD
jgi:hypothetical protein